MGNLMFISGVASNINYFSKTSGSVRVRRGRGSGSVRTHHTVSFRVDNKSASFSGNPDVGEGDSVTVIGWNIGGGIAALIVSNNSTGIEYSNLWPIIMKITWGGVSALVGLAFLSGSIGFAILLLCVGTSLIYLGIQQLQKVNQLKLQSKKI
jgi:hypothetical protein